MRSTRKPSWPLSVFVALVSGLMVVSATSVVWAEDADEETSEEEVDGQDLVEDEEADDEADVADTETSGDDKDDADKADDEPIEWFPGWTIGGNLGWGFSSLNDLSRTVFDPNNIEPIDAAGLMRIEGSGGPYLTKKALVEGYFGYMSTVGSNTSFSMVYGGIKPALVFPEHRFEFILGLKLGIGGYSYAGDRIDIAGNTLSDAGYDGWGMLVEPQLTYRHVAYQTMAVDVSLGFAQFIALSRSDNDVAVDLDELSESGDNPLDWAAPTLSIGLVWGKIPPRPPKALSPEGDEDLDEVKNADDKCPREAEDADGFEDEDGCPDLDNDKDGVADTTDKCADKAEDKDGFEDQDGCPDLDNDADGVADTSDKCANEAEDKDGFEDEDGCPDLDNDKDGIPDVDDQCPDAAEDKDGHEDADGCPELDDDGDRIGDDVDKCKGDPETYNGVDDTDGCPDKDKAKIWVDDGKIALGEPLKWNNKGTFLPGVSKTSLDQIAALLTANAWIKFIQINVHTDDRGNKDANIKLAVERADVIKAHLISKGIDEKRIKTSATGPGKPLVKTDGLKGKELTDARNKNRRVEFIVFAKPSPIKDPVRKKAAPKTEAPKADDAVKADDKAPAPADVPADKK